MCPEPHHGQSRHQLYPFDLQRDVKSVCTCAVAVKWAGGYFWKASGLIFTELFYANKVDPHAMMLVGYN